MILPMWISVPKYDAVFYSLGFGSKRGTCIQWSHVLLCHIISWQIVLAAGTYLFVVGVPGHQTDTFLWGNLSYLVSFNPSSTSLFSLWSIRTMNFNWCSSFSILNECNSFRLEVLEVFSDISCSIHARTPPRKAIQTTTVHASNRDPLSTCKSTQTYWVMGKLVSDKDSSHRWVSFGWLSWCCHVLNRRVNWNLDMYPHQSNTMIDACAMISTWIGIVINLWV